MLETKAELDRGKALAIGFTGYIAIYCSLAESRVPVVEQWSGGGGWCQTELLLRVVLWLSWGFDNNTSDIFSMNTGGWRVWIEELVVQL